MRNHRLRIYSRPTRRDLRRQLRHLTWSINQWRADHGI